MYASMPPQNFFFTKMPMPHISSFYELENNHSEEKMKTMIFIKMTIMHPFPHLFTFYDPKGLW
jgi:hypothetical protein